MGRICLYSIISVWTIAGCAVEDDALDPGSAEPELQLDWELESALDADPPACPADAPDCDRLDAPDVDDPADDVFVPGELATADEDAGGGISAWALADPLTSSGKYRIWPRGRIPYRFAKNANGTYQLNATTRARVSAAMTNWSTLTEGRIKFRARLATDTAYVLIKLGQPKVSPFVGYRAGQVQTLSLRQDEYLTVTKHELGHVIGLHHEQRRSDRLSYIQVRSGNIVNTATCKYQFSVCSTCKKVGLYDRVSVMHYRTTDMANCRTGPVLLKLDGSAISHVWQVSVRDRNSVAAMYDTILRIGADDEVAAGLEVLPESGSLAARGRCVDVAGGATAVGAPIVASDCRGTGSQDWRATRDGQLRVSHSLRCTAVIGDSAPGAAVEQAACAAEPPQTWTFTGMELVSGHSGACVDVANGRYVAGAAVGAGTCTGAASQQLDYRPDLEAIQAGGLCLTAKDAVGDDVVLRPCDGRAGQRWFQARGGFVSRASTGQCLSQTGARIALADCTDDDTQRWALRGAIRDARAGLCLQGGAAAEGALALATCTGADAQTWTFWSR